MGLHYPATDIPRVRSACEFLGQLLSFQFAREEGWMRAGDGRYELQSPIMHDAFRRDGFAISTDPETIDRRAVWNFLCTSYWSAGIDYPAVDRAIDNSLCFTLIAPDGGLAGFAPVETAIIAQSARYHRKGMPVPGPMAALFGEGDAARLYRLAALLRLAEDLERSRDQLVRGTRIELSDGEVELTLIAEGEAAVPRWAAGRERELFERAMDLLRVDMCYLEIRPEAWA